MKTFTISYRVVPPVEPRQSITFAYDVHAGGDWDAKMYADIKLEEDVRRMLGIFERDWVRRVTILRPR